MWNFPRFPSHLGSSARDSKLSFGSVYDKDIWTETLPFSSSSPILSSLLVVTNIGASLDCSPRSPLWLHIPSLLAYSLHSRPVYPVLRCARLIGCTLALRVVSRAFPLPLASPVYSLAHLPSHVGWLTVVPFPYSFHINPLLCPTNLTHALSSTFSPH